MKQTFHIDALPLKSGNVTVTDNGWLRAPANLTRTGVYEYRRMDGTVTRYFRPPEEVFSEDSLKSLQMVPITDGHPSRPLDATTTKTQAIGHIGENVTRDGQFVRANVMITDAKAVQEILSGKKVQLSCGYFSEDDDTPGEYQGMKYDSIQRNIRANHVALCVAGKQGPEVRIKLDSDIDTVIFIDNQVEDTLRMIKYTIDAVSYEVSEPVAQALAKSDEAVARDLNAAKNALIAVTAKADSLEAELRKTTEALKAASDPTALRAAIAARVALETKASEICKDVKFDSMSDLEIKKTVVETLRGEKLTRTDAPYIEAAYDFALALKPVIKTGYVPAEALKVDSKPTAAELRKQMIQASEDAWKNLKSKE